MSEVAAEIINGELDALKTDINAGFNPNTLLKLSEKPVGYMSLLTLAVAACQETEAHQLVASGAAVDGGEGVSSPLVLAAGSGQASLTEFLIQHGATLDKVDVNGHTALEDAVRQHQLVSPTLDPNDRRDRKTLAISMVGVTGFEPATPTSRT